jgi:hypothetical protein
MPRQTLSFVPRLLRRGLGILASVLEAALSRRGLIVLFFLLFLGFAVGPWIHPPLSRDIRGLELPLGVLFSDPSRAEAILAGPPRIALLGAGVLLTVIAGCGAIFTLLRPERFERVAGVLLCATIGLGATSLFNHPLLVERMNEESMERIQITALFERADIDGMTRPSSARVRRTRGGPGAGGEAGLSGLPFVGSWRWLLPVAAVGYLFGGSRPLRQRLVGLVGWVLLGCLLATLLCGRRLYSEHLWNRANRLEAVGDFEAAERALRSATTWFPEFRALSRTRHLMGRIDRLEGRQTPAATLFVAHRLVEIGQYGAASAMMRQLQSRNPDDAVISHELARTLVARARTRYFQGRPEEARDALNEARRLTPIEYDGAFFLAMIDRQLGAPPEVVERHLEPIFRLCSDRALRADAMVVLGDALFNAGRIAEAREWYLSSLRTFDLPKEINYEAREGLLGL